jgi:hypothetical protein
LNGISIGSHVCEEFASKVLTQTLKKYLVITVEFFTDQAIFLCRR